MYQCHNSMTIITISLTQLYYFIVAVKTTLPTVQIIYILYYYYWFIINCRRSLTGQQHLSIPAL